MKVLRALLFPLALVVVVAGLVLIGFVAIGMAGGWAVDR